MVAIGWRNDLHIVSRNQAGRQEVVMRCGGVGKVGVENRRDKKRRNTVGGKLR